MFNIFQPRQVRRCVLISRDAILSQLFNRWLTKWSSNGTVYSADDVHKLSLATLHNEFATVVSTQTLMTALEQD